MLDIIENADYFLEVLNSFFSNIIQLKGKVAFWPEQRILIVNVAKIAIFFRTPGSLSWTQSINRLIVGVDNTFWNTVRQAQGGYL